MDGDPRETDEELIRRLQKDEEEVRPAEKVEEVAPVDLDRAPAEGHSQEPM